MVLQLQTVRQPILVKLSWNSRSSQLSFSVKQKKINVPFANGGGTFIFANTISV
ncbi:hypothetical protein GGD38_000732 [Chitinophagaceae bacterium OAS944]|nr:hypothetical protein [Chitinophagaceae bacterium OAS944]